MPKISEVSYSTQLKGLAITAVVVLHLLTTLPAWFGTDPQHTTWFAVTDQLMRFCVPLFVAISGFGLTKKYLKVPFHFTTFVQRRVFKLLPLYIVWSLASLLIFSLALVWRFSLNGLPIWWNLVLGKADYHLYFVPMIFQLYMLFPFLVWLLRRSRKALFVSALVIQAGAYFFYYLVVSKMVTVPFILNDQRQYLPFFSWIFYFVLGMTLASIEEKKRHPLLQSGMFALGIGLCVSLWTGLEATAISSDTIMTLRSTRLPQMIYASGLIVVLLSYVERFWQPFRSLFTAVGKHSYLIYLAHPLLLRLFLAGHQGNIDAFTLLLASCVYAVALWISVRFFGQE